MMFQSDCIAGASLQEFDAWRGLDDRPCGGYRSEGVRSKAFYDWVRSLNVCGLTAMDVGCDAPRAGRTRRDIPLDGREHDFALPQICGNSAALQNDQRSQGGRPLNDVVAVVLEEGVSPSGPRTDPRPTDKLFAAA
jgi:AraC family transcriptional activator of tynA and feaB